MEEVLKPTCLGSWDMVFLSVACVDSRLKKRNNYLLSQALAFYTNLLSNLDNYDSAYH